MKYPVHHLKNMWGQLEQKPCWLGSGITDINSVEIFEGSKVIFGEHELCGVVVFKDAMFQIAYYSDDNEQYHSILGSCHGFVDVEVVGHIQEEEP